MSKQGKVLCVVGAQYGSEGKGVIVNHIANQYDTHVRVGGSNAGHSFVHKGALYAMQVVPCGWTNPDALLIFGAGGLIDIPVLRREMQQISQVDPSVLDRFFIDANCGVISAWHRKEEGGVDGEMHKRIGSTGKGVGAARRDRVMRDPNQFHSIVRHIEVMGDEDIATVGDRTYRLSDFVQKNTSKLLTQRLSNGKDVLLEGTQGSGLSLIHGDFPYVTSADTNAAQMLADVGLSPRWCTEIMLVARVYPIRVAGNSGKLENEIEWATISRELGRPVEERTTVTKKVRRVGRWDEALVLDAVVINQPTSIALTFVDYLAAEDEGVTEYEKLSDKSRRFVEYVELVTRTPVTLVGTGGEGFKIVDRQPLTAQL